MPELLREIKKFYKKEGRSYLPWRQLGSLPADQRAYKILVSEVMLQQTQVDRVIPFYNRFIKKFPTPRALAKAKLADVLREWQGLGYNRRAKFLWEAAKVLSVAENQSSPESLRSGEIYLTPARRDSGTQLSVEFLESLPGVGPYTARAISVFAYNRCEVFIETNIRTVFMYFCFRRKKKSLSRSEVYLSGANYFSSGVSDKEILPLIAEALQKSKMQPRDFYAALMDYGTYLKQSGVKLNSRSKHYVKQSKFEGSARQLRGAILRELLKSPATLNQLIKKFSPARSKGEIERELKRLENESFLQRRGSQFHPTY